MDRTDGGGGGGVWWGVVKYGGVVLVLLLLVVEWRWGWGEGAEWGCGMGHRNAEPIGSTASRDLPEPKSERAGVDAERKQLATRGIVQPRASITVAEHLHSL